MEIDEKINEIIQQAKEEGAYKENFDAFEQEVYDQGFHDAIYFMLWNPSERSCSNCQYQNSRELLWGRVLWAKILEPKIGGIVMAWVAVNRYGDEYIFEAFPERLNCVWAPTFYEYENRVYDYVELPKGTIKKLIGRELSWDDEPVELK